MKIYEQIFMQRCFDLAVLGAGATSPNPMVGAVVVHQDRIIGEGYHRAYGRAHAEVNAIASIAPEDLPLLPHSTLYVSLEPCNIHGNTPPCTELILKKGIPRVAISCLDHTPGVDGSGVARLRAAGVEVVVGTLMEPGQRLSSIRNTFVTKNRPYIILKFAQSKDGFFAGRESRQLWLTNAFSKRLVHKWRSEVDAILVGAKTALIDNPQLTNRLYFGKSPARLLIGRKETLRRSLALFSGVPPTLVFTGEPPPTEKVEGVEWIQAGQGEELLHNLLFTVANRKMSTLMVEGGIETIAYFLRAGLWDEARVLVAGQYLTDGRPAPVLPVPPTACYSLAEDELRVYLSA